MIKDAKGMPVRTPRERLWDAIRANALDFVIADVAESAAMKYDSARDYITGLRRAGFIQEISRKKVPFKGVYVIHYTLIKDVGNAAPCVDRKGNIVERRPVNSAMWNTLRICKQPLNAKTLAALASTEDREVSEETANSYLQSLCQAGYLKIIKPAHHAVSKAMYQLLPNKNTGAKPPQITRACRVFDPNIGAVVYQEQPELAEELRDGLNNGDLSHA